jgi:uncharacterized protein (DUF58 family)
LNLRTKTLLLALFTALIAVLGDWSGDHWLASAWRLPAGLLLLGLAYESLVASAARVSLHIEAPAQVFLGRASHLQLIFAQQLRQPLLIEFAPSAPANFHLDFNIRSLRILPAAQAQTELQATPRHLGSYAWPAVRIRVAGPLGLAWWSKQVQTDYQVRVLTDLLRSAPATQGLSHIGNRNSAQLGAGAELLQLRRYQPGDPPRIVDWKASARTQRLVSRDFTEDQHLEIVIVIDAGRSSGLRAGELDRYGHYVNVAARLAQYAATQDDLVGLVVFADQPLLALPPARGSAAVVRIRNALAGTQVVANESNPLQATLRVRSLVRQRSLVVLLTDLDDATSASQLLGAVRLLLPKHLPFIAGLSSSAAETLAQAPAREWLDPYQTLAAQEYCTGLERKVQALRALGAPALVAKPDQLERAVFEAYANFRQRRRI